MGVMQPVLYNQDDGTQFAVYMDPFYFNQNNGASPAVQLGGCLPAPAGTKRTKVKSTHLRHVNGVSSSGLRGRYLVCDYTTSPLWMAGGARAINSFEGKSKLGATETFQVTGQSEDKTLTTTP